MSDVGRVLVTGGAGFIGTNLVRRLVERGRDVIVLDALTEQVHAGRPWHPSAGATLVRGDIRDPETVAQCLDGVSHVVHLASETGVGQSMYEIVRYTDVNAVGTAVLLEQIVGHRARVERMVVASSRAVYGEGRYLCPTCGAVFPDGRSAEARGRGDWEPPCPMCGGPISPLPAEEGQSLRPTSVYGTTKLAQEQLVAQFCQVLGISGAALRFQNVYGPGQSLENPYTGILALFATRALAGQSIAIYEDGRQRRDFVYIDDTVESIWRALEHRETQFEVHNVGSGGPTQVLEVARILVEALDRDVALQVTGQSRAGDIRHAWADIEKVRGSWGFAPRIELREGLRRFGAWVQEQPKPTDRFTRTEEELRARHLLQGGGEGGSCS